MRNIEATPAVRIKMSGRWYRANAAVRPFDEELVRRFSRYARCGPKVYGIDPRLVEIRLGETEAPTP